MKKLFALILALSMTCACLCGCDVRDGYIADRDSDRGVITDGGNSNNGNNSSNNSNKGATTPQNTAIPGTQAVTP